MNKMKPIAEVKRRINDIIDREIEKTEKEIEDFERKINDNESYYGLGGWYTQFNKAKERREEHLEELEALKKTQGGYTVLDDVTMYAYGCPACMIKVLLSSEYGEKVYCPICERPIYKTSEREVMKVERGSRRAVLKDGRKMMLDSDGRIRE